MASFPAGGGGTPRHGRGGQQLAPWALRTALTHWRYCRRNLPPPQAQPPHKRRPRWRPRPAAMVPGGRDRGLGEDQRRGTAPVQARAPRPRAPPGHPCRSHGGRAHAAPCRGEGRSQEHAEARDAGTPLTRRALTANR